MCRLLTVGVAAVSSILQPGEKLPAERMSQGIFAVAIGSVLAGIVGGFSTIVYPDNMGMLRTTRVGSRYATLVAGLILIALGGCIKFDMLLVLVPQLLRARQRYARILRYAAIVASVQCCPPSVR